MLLFVQVVIYKSYGNNKNGVKKILRYGGDHTENNINPVEHGFRIGCRTFLNYRDHFHHQVNEHGDLEDQPDKIHQKGHYKKRKEGHPPVIPYKFKGFGNGINDSLLAEDHQGSAKR